MIDGRAEPELDAELNPEVPTLSYVSDKALEQGAGAEITGAFYQEQDFPSLCLHSMNSCSLNPSSLTREMFPLLVP